LKKGIKEMEAVLKLGEGIRNSYYYELEQRLVNWNQDDLLVLYLYNEDETRIQIRGWKNRDFITYDLKEKRELTIKDVFKPNYDEDAFARAIYKYFDDKYCDWKIKGSNLDLNRKLKFRGHLSNGFTSKGFYLLRNGNHGHQITDGFVTYEVVEAFLRDDFKQKYWKK
jgi:hypothetical protein